MFELYWIFKKKEEKNKLMIVIISSKTFKRSFLMILYLSTSGEVFVFSCSVDFLRFIEVFVKMLANDKKCETIRDLPEELIEKILKNLRGRDMISATLSCPKFNGLISKSNFCMRKIVLKCDGTKGITEMDSLIDMLSSTARKYKHLKLCNYDSFNGKFSSRLFDWETVTVSSVNFRKGSYLMNFLRHFAKIHTLRLMDVKIVKPSKVKNKLVVFHRLHTFHCDTPKRLFTSQSWLNIDQNLLVDLLHLNSKNLRYLLLHISFIPGLYGITTNLKLRSLVLVCREYKNRLLTSDRYITESLKNFLIIQKDCLSELTLETLNNELLEFIYSKMKLYKFTIGNGHVHLKAHQLHLPKNPCIRFLNMEKDLNSRELRKIFKATPELLQVKSRIFNVNMNEIMGILINEIQIVDASLVDLNYPLEYIYYTGFRVLTFNLFEGKNTEMQDTVTKNEREFHRYMVNELIQNGSSVFKYFFPDIGSAVEVPFCPNLPLFHD